MLWQALLCLLVAVFVAEGLAAPEAQAAVGYLHATASLDGPWRFHVGDDPDGKLGWAGPTLDDSAWPTVTLSKPTSEQGIEIYSGYAWYRMHLSREQLEGLGPAPWKLLVESNSVGQLDLYVNGKEVGHTRGATSPPRSYQSPPFAVSASPAADGSLTVAVRTWADAQIGRGLLVRAELGQDHWIEATLAQARAQLWDERVTAALVASFLFLNVAVLGITLYFAQRHHAEYLWLAILCLTVALRGTVETAFNLEVFDLPTSGFFAALASAFFISATLEFILLFTGRRHPRVVRAGQALSGMLPVLEGLRWIKAFDYASLAAEFSFLALVIWMLYGAWRRGQKEAGVMLLPFLLAASADSVDNLLDFTVRHGWIPARLATRQHFLGPIQFSTSTIAFLLFLASLVAVILYRFIHISQQEQRSSAELEAARSVQAMLIPTQLPSSKAFSLDSAYLPIHGVGGDFFQVIPLADESMLIVVGDVSGKGLQAAMNASTLVGALRNELASDPATVLAHLNQVMLGNPATKAENSVASFATCLCARIYPSGQMVIANAGHLSPYRDGRELELAPDLPLGIVPHMQYEQKTVQLKRGERLIFLSDGVVEAANAKGELFGFERTQQVSHEPARFIAQTAQKFGQTDDITVVSLYFVPA